MLLINAKSVLRKLRLLLRGLAAAELPPVRIDDFFKPKERLSETNYKKNCYMTWKSPYLPRSHARDLKVFISKNPQYNFYFFSDSEQSEWMEENFSGTKLLEIYKNLRFPASKSDVFRYSIVYKLGGTFFSINRFTSQPLLDFVGELEDFQLSFSKVPYIRESAFPEYPNEFKDFSVIQYTISAPPKSKVLKNALELLEIKAESYKGVKFEKVNRAIWNLTGPYLLTDAVDMYLNMGGNRLRVQGFDFLNTLWIPEGLEFRYFQSPSYMSFKNQEVLKTY